MKRSLSESSLEGDDVFDERMKSGSPSQSCNVSDRKKRRGIIEKRRRDRINNSLSELRRLVPTAFEKQGSAKLEKAEILQMTVDHLKMLHQKGLNSNYYPDPHTLAMDYRSVGFREAAAEIARYLVTVEGLDIQDPLRLRLMSHLQCFSTQREMHHTKTNIQTPAAAWNSAMSSAHIGLNSQPYGSTQPSTTSIISQHNAQNDQLSMATHTGTPLTSMSCTEARTQPLDTMTSNLTNHMRIPTTGSIAPQVPSVSSSGAQMSGLGLPTIPQRHGFEPTYAPPAGHFRY
ncbi:hairy/enhancer-of-split related with YRPW motif protein 1-like isoform X2 [Tubulanus polymorphus]|uniref:hairy/enhancer-of-split related with YRPW motif protein 1-like isoform X2 n=1 Tax=Tubulanus polymorphus TaxID=672921 RepID=UPI003DA33DCE